ncbi:serine/threonine protein kinase [Virgibacillus soli]|uniref:protein kinase domain-containing protein n=1 Tax=Paracerasibacillus soli TaxID=480284 RepID=UPI0035EDC852
MNNIQKMTLDGISFRLKEKHDFEWLAMLGKVFCIFDEQDSGNICFGVERHGVKKFVKYAGAKTIGYSGKPKDAVARLKQSISLYKELKHRYVVKLIDHFQVSEGYALVFEWFNGECLHSHWSFPPPEKYTHPDSPYFRFKQLPIELRLASLNCIFEFHVHVEKRHFVAIDFYDGSILYDFNNNRTMICDIDLYKSKPYINTMGRLWGSSRFMSPEEFELGAKIDERTNVFNLGAIAFGLLGGELDRSIKKWDASSELYEVALKAVEKDKEKRYETVEAFFTAWEVAVKKYPYFS